jgi:hypothetical protein
MKRAVRARLFPGNGLALFEMSMEGGARRNKSRSCRTTRPGRRSRRSRVPDGPPALVPGIANRPTGGVWRRNDPERQLAEAVDSGATEVHGRAPLLAGILNGSPEQQLHAAEPMKLRVGGMELFTKDSNGTGSYLLSDYGLTSYSASMGERFRGTDKSAHRLLLIKVV